ncbi:hypothetical protein DRQ32_10315 [bacterium]|nr:MAG: hypothetical protein DRQ32_10315 [bacterium]
MKRSRSKLSLVVVAAGFFATATAGAVEISIQGATSATILPGGAFTIQLGIDNVSLDSTGGIKGYVTGLVAAGASVTGGQAVQTHLNEFCFAGAGCFNGVATINNALYNPDDLGANAVPGQDTFLAINVDGTNLSSQSGAIDLGLANDIANVTPSPIDAVINLTANVVGVHELTIGGVWWDGVNWLPLASSTFTLRFDVPEPGTALLMGLGLLGLATSGRRKKEAQ